MKKRDVFVIGMFFVKKYRGRLAEVGIEATARQMKKQGVPPEIAALILAPEPRVPAVPDSAVPRNASLAGIAAAAVLAGCMTLAPDLETTQRHLVFKIQTAQQDAIAKLSEGRATLQQDRDTQARLAAGRAAVLSAATPEQAIAAARAAGVAP